MSGPWFDSRNALRQVTPNIIGSALIGALVFPREGLSLGLNARTVHPEAGSTKNEKGRLIYL
jgi:hypothetical protein